MLKIQELDLSNEDEVRFLFDTRSHPLVCLRLLGDPPSDFESHREWLRKNVSRKRLIYIFKDDDKCIGYCQAYSFMERDFEAGFAIHPDYHNKGYGQKMIKLFIDVMREKFKGKKMVLVVREDNFSALRVYDKLGFIRTGKQEGTILMEMEL